jgi:3-mercaptopyruvate sulfurtransferase SseA
MRLTFYFIALSLLGVVVQSGCNSAEQKNKNAAPVSAATPADGVRRVTVAELKGMLEKDQAIVIDVRNEASYNAGHIKGARLIPVGDILNHVDELPKDKLIVTYCS